VAVLVAAVTLDGPGLAGVLAAAAVALPVQIGAFAALTRVRVGTNAFLAAWVGGTVVRMAVVGLAGWALVASGLGGVLFRDVVDGAPLPGARCDPTEQRIA